jgi:hypothetical protein
MRTRARIGFVALAVVTVATCFCQRASAQAAAAACGNPQSPRELKSYQNQPTFSVSRSPDSGATVVYTRTSDNRKWTLKRCGQHYHCQVENVQPACGQHGASGTCGAPAPGNWVEVHTVYSTKPATGCDPETLDCCTSQATGDPVLVIGYHAHVTKEGPPLQPFPLPWGFATARWSGSTTGTKPPVDCKPPAQWSFILGCDFTVSEAQLGLFHHIDQARPLQTQLSKDLTREPPH